MRKSFTSESRFGSTTMIAAPRIAPVRVLRPPRVIARRKSTASSKVKVLGAMYSSEKAKRAPPRPAKAALTMNASTLYLYTDTPMQSAATGLPRSAMNARP